MDRVEQIAAALAKGGGFDAVESQQPIEQPQQPEQQAQPVDQGNQQASQEPAARPTPAPVPYERFKETRQELKSLRREKERLERELAAAQQSRPSNDAGTDTTDWISDLFGPDADATERSTGKRETAGLAGQHEDPVLQAIKQEYADRQLAQTLERFGHVPEEVMLAGLAQGLSPDKVEAAFLHLSHMMGRPNGAAPSARPTPPPRPVAGARPSNPPPAQRPKLPEESADRVDFVAQMLKQRGLQ